MRAAAAFVLALAGALAFATPARADERILSFDSKILVQPDGSLDVTEDIRVRAEGNNIRRGIYRDFPTRYSDRYGNSVVVDFQLLGVQRDGHDTPNFTENLSNGVRINTGDDSFLPVPAEYTYSIHYKVTRELGFFPDHDELYWNVNGLGWMFSIDKLEATVTLPSPVPATALKLEAYTGPAGYKGSDYTASVLGPGVVQFSHKGTVGPYDGMTLVVSFPKGVVPEPTTSQRIGWFLRDNRGVMVGLGGLLLLAAFYYWRWLQVGRDPDAGPIFPHYEPPEGFSPAELRMLRRMSGDRLCFTADVLDMGVRGYLRIHGTPNVFGWRLERVEGAHLDMLTPNQRVLATKLFAAGDQVALKNSQASLISGAITAHEAAMDKKLQPRFFKSNGGTIGFGLIGSIIVGVIAVMVSGGHGIPVLVVLGVLAVVLHGTFGYLLKAPTLEGRKLLDRIEGLRMYMDVAERDELKSLRGPGSDAPPALDAKRYEALLPYAMALEVEKGWTDKFIAAVGAAAAQQSSPSWYNGSGGPMGLASVGHHLGNTLNSQISSAATAPGSSSGSGGGGSSGGGGGGGGGGGR